MIIIIYLYDQAVCDDLNKSLDTNTVRVIDPEAAIDIVAQIKDDNIVFPVVVVTRDGNYSIDTKRWNFALAKKGIPASIDLETNKIYNEKSLPIDLRYNLTVLTTNTVDMDEIVKELIFKYLQMYFLTIKLPYESDRKIRFGVSISPDAQIELQSGSIEYIKSGSLYQTIIPLTCEGCVLLSYTPHQLHHWGFPDIVPLSQSQAGPLKKENERRDIYNEVQKPKYDK